MKNTVTVNGVGLAAEGLHLDMIRRWVDYQVVEMTVEQCGGNKTEAGRRLGLCRETIRRIQQRGESDERRCTD